MKIPFPFKKNEVVNQKQQSKTLIAVPTTGTMLPSMVNDLIALLTMCRLNWVFHTCDSCVLQTARNDAVKRMFETGCDGILFIDSDQTFPHYALNRLLEVNKPIVGYPIVRKTQPYDPNISLFNEEKNQYECYRNYPQGRTFKVGYIGMGFTYIKKEVFEKIEFPYFDFPFIERNGEKIMMGEDVYLCQKAREAGIDVWADSTIEIGHIGNFNYMPRLHFNFQNVIKESVKDDTKRPSDGVSGSCS